MSILKFTPKTTEQTTVSEIQKLQQHYDADGKRFYLVTRHTDKYQQNTFNMLFLKEIIAYYNDPHDKTNILTLISLGEWIKFMGINPKHADALIEGFLSEESYFVDIAINEEFLPFAGTDECCYSNFDTKECIPLYMVNYRGELENPSGLGSDGENIPIAAYYVPLSHLEAIELIFDTYSKCVDLELFSDSRFIEVWQNYLDLIREHATAENLEQIHQGYWFSLCPELTNITNTSNVVN
ncbi:MAG: hypothetical protein E6Q33_02395 [Neisseriales bacterium]|nr:MAG: hypothetical protein E6Q33_02395 [Neisseriales bacterium]